MAAAAQDDAAACAGGSAVAQALRSPEMRINAGLLRAVGLWAVSSGSAWRRAAYRLYSSVAYGCNGVVVLSVCVQLWLFRYDLEQLTDNLSVTLAHVANICKIVPLLFMQKVVGAPLATLRALWAAGEARGEAERAVHAATMRRVRRLSVAYTALFLSTYVVWELTALVRSTVLVRRIDDGANSSAVFERQLPVRAWYPFDMATGPAFSCAFALHSVGFFYTVSSVCTTNLFYFVLVIHATTQFRVLNVSLRRVRERALERLPAGAGAGAGAAPHALSDADARRLDAAMHALLGDCVRHHQGTLRFAKQIRYLMEPIMFAECVTMSIQLCVLIFQATTQPLTSPVFLSEVSFLFCEMTQLFLHCFFGTELIYESQLVQDAAYDSKWYTAYSNSYRKSIVIIMSRAFRQSDIRALSFSTVSLQLFTGLLKASYSYYTLLRQVHDEEPEHSLE